MEAAILQQGDPVEVTQGKTPVSRTIVANQPTPHHAAHTYTRQALARDGPVEAQGARTRAPHTHGDLIRVSMYMVGP